MIPQAGSLCQEALRRPCAQAGPALTRAGLAALGASGNARSRQASRPPARGRTLVMPFRRSISAIFAAVASFGQAQNRITSPCRGISVVALLQFFGRHGE